MTDSHEIEIELPGFTLQLPRWEPLQLGPLTIDLSPTKHVVFMLLAAILVATLMIWTARRVARQDAGRAPSGLANLVEAFVIYLRDEVALANIGHGGERYVPYVLTLFFFILFTNLLGSCRSARRPRQLSVTAALALLSLGVIEVAGFRALGAARLREDDLLCARGHGAGRQGVDAVDHDAGRARSGS